MVEVGVFRRGWANVCANFRWKRTSPINLFWFRKTRLITLSFIVKISAVSSFVSSQSTRVTDRHTDRQNYDHQDRVSIAASRSKNVTLAENLNADMQITWVRDPITIFVTETMMKEYDMDRDLWLIAYFRRRQIDRNCVVSYVFPSIHIYFFWKKKDDSQGGSLAARSFDLARLASQHHCMDSLQEWMFSSFLG